MLQDPRPSPTEIYFPPIVGPMKVRFWNMRPYRRTPCKLEAHCHFCNWTFFYWTEAECKQKLSEHIWLTHSHPPKPRTRNALTPPGL